MLTMMVAGALAIGLAQQVDTTFAVRPGGRLNVELINGSVNITTWDRAEIRIRSTGRIEIDRSSSGVSIEPDHRRVTQRSQLEVTVPRNYSVSAEGVNLPVRVRGLQGRVTVENVEGDITIADHAGEIQVESVSGSVALENVRGNVSVSAVNQAVRLTGVRGTVEVEAVNGSIVMQRIESARVEANAVNGLVDYDGTITDGGRYYLGTHNGQIVISVPEQTNARFTVNTHNGRIETAFPVQVTGSRAEGELTMTLGNGSARVEVESFNGSVRLVRPRTR